MGSSLEVLALGKGQLGIFGAIADSHESREIQIWLKTQPEVIRVEERADRQMLAIFYQDQGKTAGRLSRALKDQIHVLQVREKQDVQDEFKVQVAHSLPGRVRFRIEGLASNEVGSLSSFASLMSGVKKTDRLPDSKTFLVHYDPSVVSEGQILKDLKKCRPTHLKKFVPSQTPHLRWGNAIAGTAVLAGCLTQSFSFPVMATGISLIAMHPLRRSVRSLVKEGRFSIDALDVAATFAALATGRPITAAFIIWMEGVGDLLLDVSASSARNALSKLVREKDSEVCRILSDGSLEYVSTENLNIGDHLLFQTGHSVAVDGKVIRGFAELDEKALTGESHLVSKREGDKVLASTVIVEGQVVVEVEALASNTQAAKIEQVLSTVGEKPLTLQKEALAFGGKLVPPTFGMAGFAAAMASNFTPAVCVLVTDFGTGIRISVPTCALTAMNLAARENILVKGAQYMERLSKTDVVVFDKTGTLTHGVPEVVDVVLGQGMDESTLIFYSASAEARQEHPVAKALRSHAKKLEVKFVEPDPESDQHTVGRGHSASVGGKKVQVGRVSWMKELGYSISFFEESIQKLRDDQISSICVAVDGEVIGLIGYSDGSRPESAAIIRKLSAGGRRRVILLSGDSPEVVQKVAKEVGIEEAVGGLLPDEKADFIRALKSEGHVVAMVGDGINDAPALALADVGISIAGSTEVALETADVILLEGGLSRLPKAFSISDRTMVRVKRNLGVVVIPNAIAICLGAFGLLSPALAAVVNNGSTIAAVLVGTFPLLLAKDRRGAKTSNEAAKPHQLAVDKKQNDKVTRIYPRNGHLKNHKKSGPAKLSQPVVLAPESPAAEQASRPENWKEIQLKNTPDAGLFARFEEKYFIPKQQGESFKKEILKTFKRSIYVPGTEFTEIESTYLDSPDLEIYRMHFSGVPERFKIRARRYAPNGIAGDGRAHVEYKSKSEGVSRKTRFQVGPEEFGLLWGGKKIPASSKKIRSWNEDLKAGQLKDRVKRINQLVSLSDLKPACVVRYRREAFEGTFEGFGELRLTIDDQLQYEKVVDFSEKKPLLEENAGVQEAAIKMRNTFLSAEYLLVEVKHPGTIPSGLVQILDAHQAKKAKFSKYCYSITESILGSNSGVSSEIRREDLLEK